MKLSTLRLPHHPELKKLKIHFTLNCFFFDGDCFTFLINDALNQSLILNLASQQKSNIHKLSF